MKKIHFNKKHRAYILCFLISVMATTACKKQLDVKDPNDPTFGVNVSTEAGITAYAKGGIYFNGFNYGDGWLGDSYFSLPWGYHELMGDVIGGGGCNQTSYSGYQYLNTVSGGYNNTSSGYYSSIGGGAYNTASAYGCATIGGGYENCIDSNCAPTIAGGCGNCICWESNHSSIGGGAGNYIHGNIYGGTIAGGGYNEICRHSESSTIGGGYENQIGTQSNHSCYNVIGGGEGNTITGNYSSIIGGVNNDTDGYDNAHIIGSNITATADDTTFVNKLVSFGNVIASSGFPAGGPGNVGFGFDNGDGDTGLFSYNPALSGSNDGYLALVANDEPVLTADSGGLTRLKLAGVTYNVSRNSGTGALTLTPVA